MVVIVLPTELLMTGRGALELLEGDKGRGEGRGEGDCDDAEEVAVEDDDDDEEEEGEDEEEAEEEDDVARMVVVEDSALAAVSVFIDTTAPSLSLTLPLFLSRFRFALLDDDLSFAFISTFTDVSDFPSSSVCVSKAAF